MNIISAAATITKFLGESTCILFKISGIEIVKKITQTKAFVLIINILSKRC